MQSSGRHCCPILPASNQDPNVVQLSWWFAWWCSRAFLKRKCATLGIGKKRGKKDDYDVATGVDDGVVLFASWSKSIYVFPKWVLWESKSPQTLLPPFEDKHLEWMQTSRPTPISIKATLELSVGLVKYVRFTQIPPFHPNTPLWLSGP